MKLLFSLLFCTAAFCSAVTPLQQVQRAFPKASEWTEMQLSPDTVLLRGKLPQFHCMDAHMYCAVRTRSGIPRLAATYAVAVFENQFARFEQEGDEIRAYHANGTLLSRIHLWTAPPATFSSAPELVKLRFSGVGPGYVLCEAENLTRFPVILRSGSVYLYTYQGNTVKRSFLSLTVKPHTLKARQKQQLRLPIKSKICIHPTGLRQCERVDCVYLAYNAPPCGPGISPARILQPGIPDLGEQGYDYPIRLRDDLAVVVHRLPTGIVQWQLQFYQRRKGMWYFLQYRNVMGTHEPYSFECQGDEISIRSYGGKNLSTVVIPRSEN